MELLYQGFDGLDVAFASRIPQALSDSLEEAQRVAKENRRPEPLEWRDARMMVTEAGMRGGYAFSCDTGHDGATWAFKRPTKDDEWGVRVSVKSRCLALYGLGKVRAELHDFLGRLGTAVRPEAVSIGRVDYAVDLLIPGFELQPDAFVMHSHSTRADNHAADRETHGRSGRYTGVRVGKMPGRQVAVYDKRADVLAKSKVEWWEIWNDRRQRQGLPPLDAGDRSTSQVWRFELRAGKKHLKERWGITTWQDFDTKVGDMLRCAVQDVRYVLPQSGANRGRWPNHPAWTMVAEALDDDLFEMQSGSEPERIKEVIAAEVAAQLQAQIFGCLASFTACSAPTELTEPRELGRWAGSQVRSWLRAAPELYAEKVADVRSRRIYT